jgi:hypothetical protein
VVNSREEFLSVRLEFYPLCLIERPFFADLVVNTLPLLRKETRLWYKSTAPNGLQCRRAIAFELTSLGLDTRVFRAAYCRESALDLLMLYRYPNG